MPKGKWEWLACLECFEAVGVSISGTIGLDIEIAGQDVDDFIDRAMGVGIRIS